MKSDFPENEDDYEVGYGKPPKHSRFKKGQSGNPNGRPKKKRSRQELFDEELQSEIVVNGKKMTKAELVVRRSVNDAIKGKASALNLVIGYLPDSDDELGDFDPSFDDEIELMKLDPTTREKREKSNRQSVMSEYLMMYRYNFGSFVDFAFRELHPGEMMWDNWHIRLISNLLQFSWCSKHPGAIRRQILNLPPGYSKTHICSISFPAWILGRDPRKSVLIVSETPGHALEIRERCTELMSTPRYKRIFPNTRIRRSGKDLELTYGGRIRHAGVGHSPPSRQNDLVIIDNPQSLHNLDKLDYVPFVEIDRTLRDPKRGMIVVATRRLGENDLSAFLSGLENWGRIGMPVIATEETPWLFPPDDNHVQRKGELLHMSYEDWSDIEKHIRTIGGEAFSWQYMQGLYEPQTTGERFSHVDEHGLEWRMIGSFDPTDVTLEDLGKLRAEYLGNLSV